MATVTALVGDDGAILELYDGKRWIPYVDVLAERDALAESHAELVATLTYLLARWDTEKGFNDAMWGEARVNLAQARDLVD